MTRTRPLVAAIVLVVAAAAAAFAAVLTVAPRSAPAAAAQPTASSAEGAEGGDGAVVPTDRSRQEGGPTTQTESSPSPTATDPDPAPTEAGSGVPVGWAVAGVGVAVVAVAGAYVVGGRGRRSTPSAVPAPHVPAAHVPAAHPVPPPAAGPASDGLIDGLIAAHDLSTEPAVRASLEQTLRGAGVLPLAPPTGDPFDEAVHEVVGVRAASSPTDVGRVASVVRYGWSASHRLIRPAQVLVHR